MDDQKNLIIAVVIATAILIGYYAFVLGPMEERQREALEAQRAAQEAAEQLGEQAGLPSVEGQDGVTDVSQGGQAPRAEAIARSERVRVETPELSGSIALRGARIDDLALLRYNREVDADSGNVILFTPPEAEDSYYALHGWLGSGDLPGLDTEWRLVSGDALTPDTPVTLGYTSTEGFEFRRTISVDEHFMFTITDRVTNASGEPRALSPYGVVRRDGIPEDAANFFILHEGMAGVLDNSLVLRKYNRMQKDQQLERRSVGGWVGITDKYWLAALAPSPNAAFEGEYRAIPRGDETRFQASWQMDPIEIADSETIEVTTRLFAGAKRAELLREYESTLGIDKFDLAIDWGNFWFLTKPFFLLLEYFAGLSGNFGVAILMVTVVVKLLTFPLANASYKSMARMKKLQPKVQELRERFKADPRRQQQEMMQLYQREKVNPLAGCLPMLVQMPILFALYKTLFVTIEMRHAPFFGWIDDLSAKDPTNIWNLFGLLPYDPAAIPILGALIGGAGFLAIGIWPLLYGASMSATMTLNPPPPDPMQAKIFALMPWIFMFILAPWAAGLLIYWTWNNVLTFLQQYFIIRRQGVDTPIGTFISKRYNQLRARLASGGGASGGGG